MPAMTGGESLRESESSDSEELDGSTISIVEVVNTVSLRPTMMPEAGFCSHPA